MPRYINISDSKFQSDSTTGYPFLLIDYARLTLRQSLNEKLIESSLLAFAQSLTLEHGGDFNLPAHPYLEVIYKDKSPKIILEKGSQMGLSVYGMLRAIHGCLYSYPTGVIYYFPTDSGVSDFSRSRIAPLIERNRSLQSQVKTTDSAHIKKIGKSFLYLRGLTSSIQALSTPADCLVFDELNEISPASHQIAQERLSHSTFKHEVQISTPSLPDYGIDRDFQQSDQHHWLIKCEACNRYNNLVDRFPDCIVGDEYQCLCGKTLDRLAGQWVAKYPDRDIRGYHIPQLIGQHVSPSVIMQKYARSVSRAEFMRKTIGIPFVESDDQLVSADVMACCGSHNMEVPDDVCSMGIDVGKNLHYVIMTLNGKVVRFGSETSLEELFNVMSRYKLYRIVIDANPETRLSRELVDRYKGKAFACYYGRMSGSSWDEAKGTVRTDRTTQCDTVAQGIRTKFYQFPRADLCEGDFVDQLCGTARVLQEDATTGDKRYIWQKLRDDHYFHALLYATVAKGEHSPFFAFLT